LIYPNGNPLVGADWHNAISVEVDVPHREHEGAEENERFYFDPNEDLASWVEGSEKRSAARVYASVTSRLRTDCLRWNWPRPPKAKMQRCKQLRIVRESGFPLALYRRSPDHR